MPASPWPRSGAGRSGADCGLPSLITALESRRTTYTESSTSSLPRKEPAGPAWGFRWYGTQSRSMKGFCAYGPARNKATAAAFLRCSCQPLKGNSDYDLRTAASKSDLIRISLEQLQSRAILSFYLL